MAYIFDSYRQRPAVPAAKPVQATPRKRPSLEWIAFAVAILLPILTLCWRNLHGRLANQAVLVESRQQRAVRIPWHGLDPARPPPNTQSQQAATKPRLAPDRTAGDTLPAAAPAAVDNPPETLPPVEARTESSTAHAWARPSPRGPFGAPAILPVPAQKEPVATFAPGPLPPDMTSGRAVASAPPAPTAGNARPAGNAAAAPGVPAQPASSSVKPMATVADPELERLLAEAWGLIERGDYEPGSSKLLEARRRNRDDPRADFSLGLLDALVRRDWGAAEKRFADCVRRDPENVPSLNNLAIAKLHNKREAEAVKHWQAVVERRAATAEVVQNLGRLRQLIKEGRFRKSASLVKSVDNLYTEAAIATSKSAQPKGGFQLMALQLTDGRSVSWANAGRMTDTSPVHVPVDPRMRQAGPLPPGATGTMPPAPNMPVLPRNSRARR